MTTQRTRSRSGSYTARLHQRTAAVRPVRQWPAWLATPNLPTLLALGAELGHLTAALIEWPESPLRGVVHILAGAAHGIIAVTVYFGRTRLWLLLGATLNMILPAAWLTGSLIDSPLYRNCPLLAAGALTAAELTLAVLLANDPQPPPRSHRQPVQRDGTTTAV